LESIKEAGGSCRMDLGGLLHIRTMQGEVGQLDEQGGQSSSWSAVRTLSCASGQEFQRKGF